MRRRAGLVLLMGLAWLTPGSVLSPESSRAAEALVDGIAAQVGSEIVLVSEVRRRSAPVEQQMVAAGAPLREIARLRADILESLIERALIRQLVQRNEMGASDFEVDNSIAAIGQENGLTPEQLQQSVIAQGLPYEVYREQIRAEIEHTKVINNMVASRVEIDPAELRTIFDREFAEQPEGGEEVHLLHLLVPAQGSTPAARRVACERTASARQRIAAGEDFGNVAAEMSPVNVARRGDLGWIHVNSMAEWMAPAVAELELGGLSPVLETRFGCNLIRLVQRRSYQRVTFEEVRKQIRDRLFEERMREEYTAFTNRLRERTYIERKGFFADAALLGAGGPGNVGSQGSAP